MEKCAAGRLFGGHHVSSSAASLLDDLHLSCHSILSLASHRQPSGLASHLSFCLSVALCIIFLQQYFYALVQYSPSPFDVPTMFPQLSHIYPPSDSDLWEKEPWTPSSHLSSGKLQQTQELFWEIGTGSTWLPCVCTKSILLQLLRSRAAIKQGTQKALLWQTCSGMTLPYHQVLPPKPEYWLITHHHTLKKLSGWPRKTIQLWTYGVLMHRDLLGVVCLFSSSQYGFCLSPSSSTLHRLI